jgi:DNA-binding FrmR family transcriptional regulator
MNEKEHSDIAHAHNNGNEPLVNNHSHTHTHTKSVLNRLSRAIGHLTAVRSMVEHGRDCAEVLIQLAAVRSAINKTCEVILKDHLEHCVVDAINTGDMETLKELKRAVELLMKS